MNPRTCSPLWGADSSPFTGGAWCVKDGWRRFDRMVKYKLKLKTTVHNGADWEFTKTNVI